MKNYKNGKFLGRCATAVLGASIVIGVVFIGVASGTESSALTYQTESSMSFTFSSMISINVSSSTIDIPTLAPGTTAESDPITVTVATNTAYGYSLYADVGNSTDYNTDSLVHSSEDNSSDSSNSSTPSVFTSIATNASLSQLTTDNTWGYSYKPSTESTWSTYNGLPLYTTTEDHTSTTNPALLIDTKDPGDSSKSIDFKIAARSSSTQPSGTYSNVINFYAVGKPQVFYMQDVATWGSTLSQGDTMEAVDARDGQEYTVARLADNKIWMIKNLNLAGGTEITSELSNVPDNYTLPTANGFQSGNKLPASSTSGFNDDTKAFVYNSTKTSGTDCSSPGCYSYYSWTAATAGSGLSIADDNTDAPYSICPKGWKIPSSRTTSVADWKTESDFYKLAVAYGMDPGDTWQSTSNFFNQAGPGTTPNFLLTGCYGYGSFSNGGSYGYYWSSTSVNSSRARILPFDLSYVNSADHYYRNYGLAVRCIAE